MNYLDARDVMGRNRLVPRRQSQRVIKALVADLAADDADLAGFPANDYEALRELVRSTASGLRDHPPLPRNLAIYHAIRDRVPSFNWSIADGEAVSNDRRVRIDAPFVEGLRPSLVSLLLRAIDQQATSSLHERFRCVYRLAPEVVMQLARLLDRRDVVSPSEADLDRVVAWIEAGLAGRTLTVITPVCPDYEAREVAEDVFRYTFDGLGDGVGVVARRYLGVLPELASVLGAIGLSVRFLAPIGDFEGFSETTLRRVGITAEEFQARLARSQAVLRSRSPVAIETPSFTDLCGGRDRWDEIFEPIRAGFEAGDYGNTGLDEHAIETVILSRRGLYRRWIPNASDLDLRRLLLHQAAEYATMGVVIRTFIKDSLVFGADHARMAPFYRYREPVPILYLRNNYLGAH